jgi:hypothetical protein
MQNFRERQRLLQRLGYGVNNAEGDAVVVQEVSNVPVVSQSKLVNVGQGAYNPPFKAQFQVSVIPLYFTELADVYTSIAAGALNAQLRVALPFFLFGNIDFDSGYPLLKGQFPLSGGWAYNPPVVYGKTVTPAAAFGPWDATVTAQLRDGDLVFPYTATVGGTNYMALKIVRTADVPFATLLGATSSNLFGINMIRYVVATNGAADLAQYANPIVCGDETMFGKFEKDTVNPEAFKNPEQQQDNIIDIDFLFRVSKQKSLSSYFNYDAGAIRLQMFVSYAEKVA